MIIQYPSKALRMKAEDVLPEEIGTNEFMEFLDLLGNILVVSCSPGIAATQIGVMKKIVLINKGILTEDNRVFALINPKIIGSSGTMKSEEVCASFDTLEHTRPRHETIAVQWQEIEGNLRVDQFTGVASAILQHEIEHLEGKCMLDNLKPLSRKNKLRKFIKAKKQAEFASQLQI